MVRDGDDDCVDVRPGEEVLVVLVDIHLDFLLSQGCVMLRYLPDEPLTLDVIDVASGDYADIRHGEEKVQQHDDLLSQADEAEGDLVISGLFGCGRRRGGCGVHHAGGQHDACRPDG